MKRIVAVGLLAVSTCILLTGCHVKHKWQKATCTEPKTCLVGGETKGEALGHTWVEATCTEPRTCSVCGETEGEALGHTWQEATCTEAKTCSVCEEIEGEALGHTWQEATCQMPKTCSVCGETEGEITDHKWQEATCTTPRTCSMCRETEGEALGHEWQEATCTEPKTCSVCGKTEGVALGHDLVDNECTVCHIHIVELNFGNYKDYFTYTSTDKENTSTLNNGNKKGEVWFDFTPVDSKYIFDSVEVSYVVSTYASRPGYTGRRYEGTYVLGDLKESRFSVEYLSWFRSNDEIGLGVSCFVSGWGIIGVSGIVTWY